MKEIEIKYLGIPLKIVGTYEPEEEGKMYYGDMSGLSSSASSFDINEIYATDSNIDIFDLFTAKDMRKLNELVIEKIEE